MAKIDNPLSGKITPEQLEKLKGRRVVVAIAAGYGEAAGPSNVIQELLELNKRHGLDLSVTVVGPSDRKLIKLFESIGTLTYIPLNIVIADIIGSMASQPRIGIAKSMLKLRAVRNQLQQVILNEDPDLLIGNYIALGFVYKSLHSDNNSRKPLVIGLDPYILHSQTLGTSDVYDVDRIPPRIISQLLKLYFGHLTSNPDQDRVSALTLIANDAPGEVTTLPGTDNYGIPTILAPEQALNDNLGKKAADWLQQQKQAQNQTIIFTQGTFTDVHGEDLFQMVANFCQNNENISVLMINPDAFNEYKNQFNLSKLPNLKILDSYIPLHYVLQAELADLFVHHGGIGSTIAGWASGLPNIALATVDEQKYNYGKAQGIFNPNEPSIPPAGIQDVLDSDRPAEALMQLIRSHPDHNKRPNQLHLLDESANIALTIILNAWLKHIQDTEA